LIFTGSFWGVVFAFATVTDCALLCQYAGLTCSIALTIMHFDGKSTLSLHNIVGQLTILSKFLGKWAAKRRGRRIMAAALKTYT
jgi:hypothetical protein